MTELCIRWGAQYREEDPEEVTGTAVLKLTCGVPFKATDKQHVFAVLSQRLCLDLVLSHGEAFELADRSVSHHMRMLTGYSYEEPIFYTRSPSEPILALAAFELMYPGGQNRRLGAVFGTLSRDLCSSGLIEKGLLGELGTRALLLVARDCTVLRKREPNVAKPVRLLEVLGTLFGDDEWGKPHQEQFNEAFKDAYVNFTHWIMTDDALPGEPNR